MLLLSGAPDATPQQPCDDCAPRPNSMKDIALDQQASAAPAVVAEDAMCDTPPHVAARDRFAACDENGNEHKLRQTPLVARRRPRRHGSNGAYEEQEEEAEFLGLKNIVPRHRSPKSLEEMITKREAFFKSEAPATRFDAPSTKFDPSLRERDGKAEKTTADRLPTAQVPPQQQPQSQQQQQLAGQHSMAGREAVKDVAVAGGAAARAGSRSDGSGKDLEGYVGFANLPNQVYRKAVKQGFEFTLMVVGESGLGKSTLINSLFLSDLYSAEYPGPSQRIKKTVQVETTQTLLREGGVQLKLTVVDTPGFGDAVDNSNCWQPVIDYIDSKYDEYLNAEARVNRRAMPDNRVHCCLYFIAPSGHGLKPLDIEFMKRLHEKVNVIPMIAKADTMTPEECKDFKKTILAEIAQHKIRIYEFPDVDDEEENKILKKLKDRVPYAVVGSNRVIEVGGKKVRGRQYPWGIVEVENLEHNDFLALRDMLIRTHMQDLKDVTNNVHYENFRYNKLAAVSSTGEGKARNNIGSRDPLSQMEEEKKDHMLKMKKMEAEMEQVFEMKVKEKVQKLKDSETDLLRRSEQMKKSVEAQQAELAARRKEFEQEKVSWDEQQRAHAAVLMAGSGDEAQKKKKGMF